ncbi:MAG: NmrA family transcriptional regulator [Anaerolineaceae bacterium]|nr:NmrA family transcriptional regulator [Anaerolineaceae bacterium]
MKITIFGATGRTGILLVEQALAAGHEVVAFVRSPEKMPIEHISLSLVQGNVIHKEDVTKVITPDVDAVISVLGPTRNSSANLMAVAADNILNAMREKDVKRLIFMTGAGVSTPGDQPKLINHIIKFALKALSGEVLKQSEQAVETVRNSDRRWTVVRVPMLTDASYTGKLRVGMVGVNTGSRLTRADAAAFILNQLTDETYIRKSPVISN